MVLSFTLWKQLVDLDKQASERFDCIVLQMKVAEGVTEELKASQQLVWVQRMNNIRNRAEEIILTE